VSEKFLKKSSPYDTSFDKIGREIISEKIRERLKEVDYLNLLIIGSPDCKEINSLTKEEREKINIRVFDFEIKRKIIDDAFISSFNSCNVFSGNFFININSLLEESFYPDIIFHRWFLHHCTDEQKIKSFEIVLNMLKRDQKGELIFIDWFIPDFNNDEKLEWENTVKYYEYHEKHNIAPARTKWKTKFKNRKKEDGQGGKFTSIQNIESMMNSLNFEYERIVLGENLVDNPLLFGQNLYFCKLKR
jgi:hypothetical protein